MKFMIDFVCRDGGYSAEINEHQIGIDGLDRARNELGIDFRADIMQSCIEEFKTDPSIEIDERLARDSQRFEYVNKIRVVVYKRGILNSCVSRQTVVDRSPHDDVILGVRSMLSLDTQKVLDAWKASGYPLGWDGLEE